MSTKPAPKKKAAKKPLKTQPLKSRVNDLERLLEEYRSNVVTAFRNNGARQEEQDKRISALETLMSNVEAPKEAGQPKEWVPKVGDWYFNKMVDWDSPQRVDRIQDDWVYTKYRGDDYGYQIVTLRPATQDEVAAHKEKEAKQAEADKLAKLKWGVRVKYQDQDALYIGSRRGCHTVMVDGYLTPHITSTLSDITLKANPLHIGPKQVRALRKACMDIMKAEADRSRPDFMLRMLHAAGKISTYEMACGIGVMSMDEVVLKYGKR